MSYPDWNRCVRLCHRRSPKSADFKSGDLRWNNWVKCWLASSGLLLQKNDSCWDAIWDSRRWAPSHRWGIQDMAALLRRLQTWGPCLYRPQQPSSFYGYEKFELYTSPLGSGTFSIPLPNWVPPGQGKRNCRCLVRISSAEFWGKRHPSLREYQDSVPSAVTTSQGLRAFNESNFPSSPGLHMRNDCFFPVALFLGHFPNQNGTWKSLRQCRKCETATLQPIGKRRGSKASQRLCRASKRLERRWGSAPISRTLKRPSNHLFQGDKSSLWWSSCRAFWH